ncbi:MAG: c-type cytochrome [Gammaproteobacteria bacterium]
MGALGRRLATAFVALPLLGLGGVALAGDVAAGEAKADACLDCHTEDYFAGTSAAEIEALIRAVRAGKFAHDDVIHELAEDDIADVAAWFAHEGAK